jgi:Ca-activated chloride channel family protein
MSVLDPYLILGVTRTASAEEIKLAYRRIARRLHPDINPYSPGAASQFQDISAAYDLLIDTDRRRSFDRDNWNAPSKTARFTMSVTPSKRTIATLDEPQVLYLLVELAPDTTAETKPQRRESHVNLTLILDRSNSMNNARLDRVKMAAQQIIDQLGPEDVLSVVAFNDRAEVIIPATTVRDKASLKARVSMMSASGGTEIFQGLQAGLEQNKRFLAPRLVNHMLLLTDGNTFGDEENSRELAKSAAEQGIAISAMGLGQDWNDTFLDELATMTGGLCRYITSSTMVVQFLNDHVRNLSSVFAERMNLSIATDPDIKLESAFKLSPSPQPLDSTQGNIPLGGLQFSRPLSVLLQLELPAYLNAGFRTLARIAVVGDVFDQRMVRHLTMTDVAIEVNNAPEFEDPPMSILDALARLTLYRMQERANESLAAGNYDEATRRLERLATRLLAMGQVELATHAQAEAGRVAQTSTVSERGRKTLKYHTRLLLLDSSQDGAR